MKTRAAEIEPLANQGFSMGAIAAHPQAASTSGTVVRTLRPRTTPAKPIIRISRATVQRATTISSRASCRQTLRTP
jgi:hypothetical protein